MELRVWLRWSSAARYRPMNTRHSRTSGSAARARRASRLGAGARATAHPRSASASAKPPSSTQNAPVSGVATPKSVTLPQKNSESTPPHGRTKSSSAPPSASPLSTRLRRNRAPIIRAPGSAAATASRKRARVRVRSQRTPKYTPMAPSRNVPAKRHANPAPASAPPCHSARRSSPARPVASRISAPVASAVNTTSLAMTVVRIVPCRFRSVSRAAHAPTQPPSVRHSSAAVVSPPASEASSAATTGAHPSVMPRAMSSG